MVLKNLNETRNYFLDEIKQDELMNKNHKKSLDNSKLY